MRALVEQADLRGQIIVDSAGTHDYHVGAPPDPRAIGAAQRRGYDLSGLRARQVTPADFEAFDLLLAMDFNNLAFLQDMCPEQHRTKLGLLMPYAVNRCAVIVHDPYCRSAKDFEYVLDYIEDACKGLVHALCQRNAERPAVAAVAK